MAGKFQKGQSGNPKGRSPGTQSKKIQILNTFAQATIEGGINKFNEELAKLEGKDYINAYLQLLEYVKPKLQRVSLAGDADNPISLNITFSE